MDNSYIPSVVQVFPQADYRVIVYFDDGKIVDADIAPLLERSVFQPLQDPEIFKNACCIENNTLAWDLDGDRDSTKAIDLDPCELHALPSVNHIWACKEDVA